MKQLTIKLIGVNGSGKTTIARLIQEALKGYDVDVLATNDKDLKKGKPFHNLNTCMESLKERVYVKIETENPNWEKNK